MDKKSFKITTFKHAWEGIVATVKLESTIKVHLLIALIVIVLGFWVGLSLNDWFKVVILIGLILALEMTNTAIEVVVNSFTTAEHPGAKLAKDVSAGAVLIAAISAAICGLIIFLPYL